MRKPNLNIRTSFKVRSTGISKTRTPRTAPPSSKLPKTPHNPVELYLQLTRKARARNFKLDRFFGESDSRPRLDACTIREALDHGLAGALSSTRVLAYFFLYLLEEDFVEALFFLLKVEQFEKFPYPSFEAREQAAGLIYDTYLHPAGLLYIETITTPVRKITHDLLSRYRKGSSPSMNVCFNAAKLQAWDVLEQIFDHFISEQNKVYCQMLECFDLDSAMWGPAALDRVIRSILGSASQKYGPISEGDLSLTSQLPILPFELGQSVANWTFTDKKACLTKRIVASFLREYLEVDIYSIDRI